MSANLAQLAGFPLGYDVQQIRLEVFKKHRGHAHRSLVPQDQLFEGALPVADDVKKLLAVDGKNTAPRLVRQAIIEDAELLAREVLHNQIIPLRLFQPLARRLMVGANLHPLAALPGIGFEHDRIIEAVVGHERVKQVQSVLHGVCSADEPPTADVLLPKPFEDSGLSLPYKAAVRLDRRIGESKQGSPAILDQAGVKDIDEGDHVGHIKRPELPV